VLFRVHPWFELKILNFHLPAPKPVPQRVDAQMAAQEIDEFYGWRGDQIPQPVPEPR
jgi:hypothetical protein